MIHTSDNPPFIVMHDGVWHLYSAQYRHAGKLFGVEYYARNDVEAAAMLESMRAGLNDPCRVIAVYGGHKAREN